MKRFWILAILLSAFACPAPAQISVKFVWFKAAYADSYTLQISKDSTFATSFYDSSLPDTTITVSGLAYSTKYFWRVNASNITGTSPWSEVWYFTTANPVPAAVLLFAPSRGAVGLK